MELYTNKRWLLCSVAMLLFAMLQNCYGEVKDQDQHVVPMSVPHDHRDQTYYANTAQLISDPPNMVLFQQSPLNLLQEIVGDDLGKFGTNLLNDTSGNRVKAILINQPTEEGRIREIFRVWLNGGGVHPVTWNKLIVVLKTSGLVSLSDQVRQFVNESVLDIPGMKYDHLYPETAVVTLRNMYMEQSVIKQKLLYPSRIKFFDVVLNEINGLGTNVEVTVLNFTRLLITGQPGAGKTTYMRYLAKKWAEYKAFNYCEILLLIDLEELKFLGKKINSLTDLSTLVVFRDIEDMEKIAKTIVAKQGAGACFLIDAYDKLNMVERDMVHKIFFENHLPSSRCVMTSRPYTFESHRHIPKEIDHFELVGFNVDNLELYLDNLSNDSEIPLKNAILKQWEDNPKLKEICTLPMHLNMMIYIIEGNYSEHNIRTKTQIYTEFVSLTLRHYEEFHPNFDSNYLKECINGAFTDDHSQVCAAVQYLHGVAFNITFNNILKFQRSNHETQEKLNNLSFVSIDTVGRSHVRYTFSHPTFCEFFAALHLVAMPLEEIHKVIKLYGMKYPFSWMFYFGLLHDYKLQPPDVQSDLFKHLLHTIHYINGAKGDGFSFVNSSILQFLKEIGYSKGTCVELLTSAGIINKSEMGVHQTMLQHSSSIAYILNHLDICKVGIDIVDFATLFTLENEACSLAEDYSRLLTQLMSRGSGDKETSRMVISSVTFWSGYFHFLESIISMVYEFTEELNWMCMEEEESLHILHLIFFEEFLVTLFVVNENTDDPLLSTNSSHLFERSQIDFIRQNAFFVINENTCTDFSINHFLCEVNQISFIRQLVLLKLLTQKPFNATEWSEIAAQLGPFKRLQGIRVLYHFVHEDHQILDYVHKIHFEILKILPNLRSAIFHVTVIHDELSEVPWQYVHGFLVKKI